MKKKIGFIYLDEMHHIHHFLSPAIELSKADGIEVDILTYESSHDYLRKLIALMAGDKLNIIILDTFLYRKVIEKISKRTQPSALYIYKKHKRRLLQYDALVFTDWTASTLHKLRKDAKKPVLCFVEHGSGDRAYGYGDNNNLFDLVVVGGQKKFNRLERVMPNHRFAMKIGGYSKFDVVKAEITETKFFKNNNPIILYTPHFTHEFSSWYRLGNSVLNYFFNNTMYNLIFAPHFNLFNKKGFVHPSELNEKYFNVDNIHIDLGSVKSVNMTYTLNSDIYIGDASSQVYEFLFKSRPVIFLNVNNVKWQGDENYRMWHVGKVVKSVKELGIALLTINDWSKKYEKIQKQLFEDTFDKTNDSAGLRTARIIKDSLHY